MMKRILMIVSILCCFLSFYAEERQNVRVNKIRIFLDEAEYQWTSGGMERIDGSEAPVALKKETVISFLSVHPGLSASEKEIAKKCEESERRLKDSGYFYDATIIIIPPKIIQNERTLVVTLSSGYFMRYGGGSIWGMFGKVAISGKRESFYAYGGYNRNGISYLHSNIGGSPLALGGKLFYFGPGEYPGKLDNADVENRFSGTFTAGWSFTPDTFFGIDSTVDGFGFSSNGTFSLQPYVTQRKYLPFGSNSECGLELRGFWYPSYEAAKGESSGYLRAGITKKATVAIKGSAGYSPFDLPADACFDLYYTEDKNVRSGYSLGELIASDYVLGSAEVRYNFLELRIPPILNVTAQAFVYMDVAKTVVEDEACENDFLDAYGAGLRILFDNPVFAYFTFSYGVNHEGNGRFLFCGTAGY